VAEDVLALSGGFDGRSSTNQLLGLEQRRDRLQEKVARARDKRREARRELRMLVGSDAAAD